MLLYSLNCWFWAGKCFLGAHVTNLIYGRAEWRHRFTVFIFNFAHILHLVLVLLLLILSMYLIARSNANCNLNIFLSFLSYLLTCSISTICKNSNSSPWPNSFLNIHIWKFKRSNISGREYKPTKNPLWKIQALSWLSEFYAKFFCVSDIAANSFAQFQLGALNSEKHKYLKKRKKSFWN